MTYCRRDPDTSGPALSAQMGPGTTLVCPPGPRPKASSWSYRQDDEVHDPPFPSQGGRGSCTFCRTNICRYRLGPVGP